MKHLLAAAMALMVAATAQGAVAIYSGSVGTHTLDGGASARSTGRVYTALDLETGDTLTLSLGTQGKYKTYGKEDPVSFLLTKAANKTGPTTTVLARAEEESDASQTTRLKTVVLSGKDSYLEIGGEHAHLPRTLAGSGTAIQKLPDSPTLARFIRTTASLKLNLALTREVNQNGFDLAQAVSHLETHLREKSYYDEHNVPTPPAGTSKPGAGSVILGSNAYNVSSEGILLFVVGGPKWTSETLRFFASSDGLQSGTDLTIDGVPYKWVTVDGTSTGMAVAASGETFALKSDENPQANTFQNFFFSLPSETVVTISGLTLVR